MSLSQIVQSYRSQLIAQESHADQAIRSAHNSMLGAIQLRLGPLLKQYKDAQSGEEKVPLTWLYQDHKLSNMKYLAMHYVSQFASQAQSQVVGLQHQAIALGSKAGVAQLSTIAHPGQIKAAHVGTVKPVAGLFNVFAPEAAEKVGKALITGVSLGQEPDHINRLIMMALLICLHRALTLDRTLMMEAYRASVLATWQENEQLSKGWIWIAQAGSCPFCQSMDGSKHKLDEEMESHINCRCVQQLIAA
jgi:hypothetical protein